MSRLRRLMTKTGRAKPQASVLMPLRNSATVVADAINSVLSQQDCVLDILISDDASDDDTLQQARQTVEAYTGPHSVRLFSAVKRLWINHLHELIDRAAHPLCIEAHGDDISLPGRMHRLMMLQAETGASLITSLVDLRREDTAKPDLSAGWLTTEQCVPPNGYGLLAGARYAFNRDIHDRFPRLDSAYAPSSHDRLQAFRASLLGGVWYCDERLLFYRRHEGQGSRMMTDQRSRATTGFGWSLRHLSALRAMGNDVDHARATGLIDKPRAASLRRLLNKRTKHILTQLLNSRDDLVRAGRQALWVTEYELLLANNGKK